MIIATESQKSDFLSHFAQMKFTPPNRNFLVFRNLEAMSQDRYLDSPESMILYSTIILSEYNSQVQENHWANLSICEMTNMFAEN